MSKGSKIIASVLVAFAGISVLHVWLNIGFDKLIGKSSDKGNASFRVGFLPVT